MSNLCGINQNSIYTFPQQPNQYTHIIIFINYMWTLKNYTTNTLFLISLKTDNIKEIYEMKNHKNIYERSKLNHVDVVCVA